MVQPSLRFGQRQAHGHLRGRRRLLLRLRHDLQKGRRRLRHHQRTLALRRQSEGVPPRRKGAKRAYNTYEGPSEIIATPVVYKDRVYTQIGQDPEHGEGKGALSCIDPTGSGDLSGKPLWIYKDINRSISTPSIVDDIVYVADYSGLVHAVDANTGAKLSVYDTKGHIWGSTLFIDGKLYVGNEEGELHIIKAGKQMEKIAVIDFPGAIFATPVYANGTLYVMTMSQLYAFGTK